MQQQLLIQLQILLLVMMMTNVVAADDLDVLPKPRGRYGNKIGVHDFEFIDTTYPSPFVDDQDANGRRIMARAYYPSEESSDSLPKVCVLFYCSCFIMIHFIDTNEISI